MMATFGQLSHAGTSVKIAMGQEAGATSATIAAVLSVELGLLSEVEHADRVAPQKARARHLFRSDSLVDREVGPGRYVWVFVAFGARHAMLRRLVRLRARRT